MKYLRLLVLALLPLIPSKSYSFAFGLGPCCPCPPSVCICGIIPCDSACAGAATANLEISVSVALSTILAAHEALTATTDLVSNSVTTEGGKIINLYNSNGQLLRQGLEARTNRIELALVQARESLELTTDHTISSLRQVYSEQSLANNIDLNADTFGSISQPVSGLSMADAAPIISDAIGRNNQLFKGASKDNFMKAHDFSSEKLPRGTGYASMLKSLADNTLLEDLIEGGDLTEDNLSEALMLIEAFTQPVPISDIDDLAGEQAVTSRVLISHANIAYAVMANLAIEHVMHDGDWPSYFNSMLEDNDGMFSPNTIWSYESNSRLMNENWWLSMKMLGSAGLNRELAYMESVNNIIDLKRSELIRTGAMLKALQSTHKSEAIQ